MEGLSSVLEAVPGEGSLRCCVFFVTVSFPAFPAMLWLNQTQLPGLHGSVSHCPTHLTSHLQIL